MLRHESVNIGSLYADESVNIGTASYGATESRRKQFDQVGYNMPDE